MIKRLLSASLLLPVLLCAQDDPRRNALGSLPVAPPPLRVDAIQISGELGSFTPKWEMQLPVAGVQLATLTLEVPPSGLIEIRKTAR